MTPLPTFVYVTDAGKHQVARHIGDRHRLDVGPPWPTPRQAIDYAKALDAARGVSPIRSGEPFIAGPVALPTTSEAAGFPPTSPLRGSPVVVTNERG